MNKLNRWLDNLQPAALKQALRFILGPDDVDDSIDNIGFIKLQIEEFARMYPEYQHTWSREDY